MGRQIVLVLASHGGRDVAGAISYQSATALFGRHWGCQAEFDSLHFECCYYQGIEHCIRHGLARFEPGGAGRAQNLAWVSTHYHPLGALAGAPGV